MFQWPGPMFAASSFLPHSAPTWSIRWTFIIAMFIFYMSPIISLIWGLILTVNALREGFQKKMSNLGFWLNLRWPLPPQLRPCYVWFNIFNLFEALFSHLDHITGLGLWNLLWPLHPLTSAKSQSLSYFFFVWKPSLIGTRLISIVSKPIKL